MSGFPTSQGSKRIPSALGVEGHQGGEILSGLVIPAGGSCLCSHWLPCVPTPPTSLQGSRVPKTGKAGLILYRTCRPEQLSRGGKLPAKLLNSLAEDPSVLPTARNAWFPRVTCASLFSMSRAHGRPEVPENKRWPPQQSPADDWLRLMCAHPSNLAPGRGDGELRPPELPSGLKLDHRPFISCLPLPASYPIVYRCFLRSPSKYIFTSESLSPGQHLGKPK